MYYLNRVYKKTGERSLVLVTRKAGMRDAESWGRFGGRQRMGLLWEHGPDACIGSESHLSALNLCTQLADCQRPWLPAAATKCQLSS